MAMYRVYLRNAGWSDIAWQFASTVAAKGPEVAVQVGFEQWKGEPDSTAPATLAECDQKVDLVK